MFWQLERIPELNGWRFIWIVQPWNRGEEDVLCPLHFGSLHFYDEKQETNLWFWSALSDSVRDALMTHSTTSLCRAWSSITNWSDRRRARPFRLSFSILPKMSWTWNKCSSLDIVGLRTTCCVKWSGKQRRLLDSHSSKWKHVSVGMVTRQAKTNTGVKQLMGDYHIARGDIGTLAAEWKLK